MDQTQKPKFAGKPIVLGDTTLVVPPLALGAIKNGLHDKILTLTGLDGVQAILDHLDDMLEVILSAIHRNYPDYTAEELAEVIDLGNVVDVLTTVLGQSGYERTQGNGSGAAAE